MQARSRTAEAISAFRGGDLDRARALAAAQIADESGPPDAYHLLGLIDCRQGQVSAGVEWLRKACDAEPRNPGYRIMLVRALIDNGRATEAFAHAARPVGEGPAQTALWRARAEAADAAAETSSAAEAWHAVCSADESDWRAWLCLGRAHFLLRDYPHAEQAYHRARDLQAAEPLIIHELGSLYERSSRIADLDALLDRSLTEGVARQQLPELWAARYLRQGLAEEAFAFLAGSEVTGDEPRFYRLLAKAADAAERPAEAFAAATRMNTAAPDVDRWRKRAAEYRRELREFSRSVTPDWAAALPKPIEQDRALAFLLGFPRSGTTLLDTFLMGHPRVEVIEEQGLLFAASQDAGPLAHLPQCPAEQLQRSLRTYDRRLAEEAGSSADQLIIDKAPLNMLLAPLIHVLFGDHPILFAQRHPCDAVLSCFMQSFTPNLGMASFLDIEDAADFYDAAMSLWTAFRGVLPLKVHTVVYEGLVQDPETTLKAAVQFLGLEWEPRLLDHQSTAKTRDMIFNPSFDQVTKPLSQGAAGRWRRYEPQLAPVLPVLLPWADRLGYPR